MKKNVAGQKIGAQLVNAADGSAFTGSVTVYVTGDAGTQAVGSVGSGACTHEGNGYHTYAPAQAETNYDLVAFTFTGTGAVPVTIQVFTSFPQTGDAFARLGAPTGASVSADVAAVKAETATIVVDTNELQTDWADGGRLDTILDARASAANLATVAGYLDTEIAAILEDTGTTLPAQISGLNNLSAAQVNAEVDAALADYDVPTNAEMEARTLAAASYATATVVDAIKLKTDNLPASPAAVGSEMTLADGAITASKVASNAIAAAALAADLNVYLADIDVAIDTANERDEYTVTWLKNGVPVTSGITSPTIQVVKRADGTDLVASTAMTQIGATASYKYDEATNVITAGEAVLVIVGATIDGAARSFRRVVSRDTE